jgi:EAL domain-containing protein (putative c-di-GMP-specific phosphodiesterase class I)
MSQACAGCRNGKSLDFEFSMAFQPIVDAGRARVWGYEALVRGADGAPAGEVLARVDEENRYRFDQACRVKAIETAAELFPRSEDVKLSINFMPNAVYDPAACLRTSVAAAERVGLLRERIIFEFTEQERIEDVGHVERIVAEYRKQGFLTAIDDFGAGYSGLNLLAKFQPDIVKLDMDLVRGIESSRARQVIVAGTTWMARALGLTVLAEGIESEVELLVLKAAGIRLFQGYYFAKPAFEALPDVALGTLPALVAKSA